jgi:hypothetical protein
VDTQSVSNGAVLLGLASWYLYPQLLVLGEKATEIGLQDETISDSGQLTVGLQSPDPNKDEGVYWSLSLAHLQFYGDPVKVTSFTTLDTSRFDLREFHLLVLGSILSGRDSICPLDFIDAATFFIALDASTIKGMERYRKQSLFSAVKCALQIDWEYS